MNLIRKPTTLLILMIVTGAWLGFRYYPGNPGQDKQFELFKNYYIDELWKLYPGFASSTGFHKYDSILKPMDEKFFLEQKTFLNRMLDSLKNYNSLGLSTNNRVDMLMIKNSLESTKFYLEKFKSHEWNPSNYNVGGDFAEILNSRHDKLENKLKALSSKMLSVAGYYASAKKNIKNPTPEHTDLAIIQNNGAIGVFTGMLSDSLKRSALSPKEKKMIDERIQSSVWAIKDYIMFLEDIKNTISTSPDRRSFRIGRELYSEKFAHDIVSGYSAEDIYNKAIKRKAELLTEMIRLTGELWPVYFPGVKNSGDKRAVKMMIDTLSVKHVHRDAFLPSIEKQLPDLVKFVNQKQLVYLDPSKPLVVRPTPEYMEGGGAGASVSAPGPYGKNENTYYNVSPLTGYSEEAAESYLREYNHYILQILNIHEAIPGHYTQLVYSNQSPSIIKSIFGNGAMVEGWAVYTERMMLEEGYGGNDPAMWLMYYKWHMRVVCNTILDYSVHVLGMTETEAMKLLMEDAFQQEAEASGKWKRVCLTQVQLCSYFTGFTEIYDFREEYKMKKGSDFKIKEFHEKFLSYGSAPVKYIRELMMEKGN